MSENLFLLLDEWVSHGWIRHLDRAFARFLKEQVPESCVAVLLTSALASHQLGRGHVCLDLDVLFEDPDACLSLPPEGRQEEMVQRPSILLADMNTEDLMADLNASPVTQGDDSPLVLSGRRLYLRRYWQYSVEVGGAILRKLEQKNSLGPDFSRILDEFFNPLRDQDERDRKSVHWQSAAAVIAAGGKLSIISGGPGTGKTTTVVRLILMLQELAGEDGRLRIHLAAPTGKAAARLEESIKRAGNGFSEDIRGRLPREVTTLHRLLGSRPKSRYFRHDRNNRLNTDLVVVDEASMIDLEMMAALITAMPEDAGLILLGDKDQLASVDAGSVLGDICLNAHLPSYTGETVDFIKANSGYDLKAFAGEGSLIDQSIVVLRKSHRFGQESGIGALAAAVNGGNPENVQDVWNRGYADIARVDLGEPGVKFSELVLGGNPGKFSIEADGKGPSGYGAYLTLADEGPRDGEDEDQWLVNVLEAFDRFRILSPLRMGAWGVEGLNERVTEILRRKKLINPTGLWYAGRPVIITRNDYTLGLMNGDVGILLKVRDRQGRGETVLRAVFPDVNGSLKKILPSALGHVETVYAMTVHKSQGSEFDHAALILPETMSPVLTRELVYTGITRARRWCTVAGNNIDLLGDAVTRRIRRASGLGDLLRKKPD